MTDETTTTSATAAGLLAEIRAAEQAATPGPWRWRGNTDHGDPYLAGGYRRGPDGKPAGLRQDVLGHIPHEITRAEARAQVAADCLPEPEVAPLPEDTYAERYDAAVATQVEAEADLLVTDRFGEPATEQRLAFCSGSLYTEARKLAVYEVAPDATSREDPRVYRADITGLRHPDAIFIARARTDLAKALTALERVLAIAQEAERQATRWEDPLPVPGWVAGVRAAIAEELSS